MTSERKIGLKPTFVVYIGGCEKRIQKWGVNMSQVAEWMGWAVAVGFTLAFMNFVLKFINKKFLMKVPKKYGPLVNKYRFIMKYFVKYHKIIGSITALLVVAHFLIMLNLYGLSVTGLISAIILWSIFILGVYGVNINKNLRGKWVIPHRILAFALIVAIAKHVLF